MEKVLLDEIKKVKLFFDYNTNLTLSENLRPILLKEGPLSKLIKGNAGKTGKYIRSLLGFGDEYVIGGKTAQKTTKDMPGHKFKIGDDTYEIKSKGGAGFLRDESNKLYKNGEEVTSARIGKEEFTLKEIEDIATGKVTKSTKGKIVNVIDEVADNNPEVASKVFDDIENGLKVKGSTDEVHEAIGNGMYEAKGNKANTKTYVEEVDNYLDGFTSLTDAEKKFIKKRYFGIVDDVVDESSVTYKNIKKYYKSNLTKSGKIVNTVTNAPVGKTIVKFGKAGYEFSVHVMQTFFSSMTRYFNASYQRIRVLFTKNFNEYMSGQVSNISEALSKIDMEEIIKLGSSGDLAKIREKIIAVWRGTIQTGFLQSYEKAAIQAYESLKTAIKNDMISKGISEEEITKIFNSIETTGTGQTIDNMIRSMEKLAESNTSLADVYKAFKTNNKFWSEAGNYFANPFKKAKASWTESSEAIKKMFKFGEGGTLPVRVVRWFGKTPLVFIRECLKYAFRTATAISYSSVKLPWEILQSYGKYIGPKGLYVMKNGRKIFAGTTRTNKLFQLAAGFLETNFKLAVFKTILYPAVAATVVFIESLIETANEVTNTKEDISDKESVKATFQEEFKNQFNNLVMRTLASPAYDWNDEHYERFVETPVIKTYDGLISAINYFLESNTKEDVEVKITQEEEKYNKEKKEKLEQLLEGLKEESNKSDGKNTLANIITVIDPNYLTIKRMLNKCRPTFQDLNKINKDDCKTLLNMMTEDIVMNNEEMPNILVKRLEDYAKKNKNVENAADLEELVKNLKVGIKVNNDILKVGIPSEEDNEWYYKDEDGISSAQMIVYLPKEGGNAKPIKDALKSGDNKEDNKEDNQSNTGGQNKKQNTGGQNKNKGNSKNQSVNDPKDPFNENYIMNLIKKLIFEEEEEKTLKMKDWDEIFTFQKMDDKNPGKFTDVKIKMDSVMDRMPHWRKKYKKQCEEMENCDDDGEDDSFVRAVIDTHPDVVRILFTKGLAHLVSSEEQEDLNEGLHGLLSFIREAKNVEVEVWSVYRHPSSPDKIWSLVKGDYKPKELESMDVKMQQSPGNSVEKKKNSLDELKKKESDAISVLSSDEKKGLMGLPIKLRNKIKDKIKLGWTTEKPSEDLIEFHRENEVDSVLSDPIKIYKLRPNSDFFDHLEDNSLSNNIKRGFCRAIYYVKKELDLSKSKKEKIESILDKCENKFEGKYGQNYL